MSNKSNPSIPKEPTIKQLKARDDAFNRWKYNRTDENWALYEEALKPIEEYRNYFRSNGGYVFDNPKYSKEYVISHNGSAFKKSTKMTVSKDTDSLSNDSDDDSSSLPTEDLSSSDSKYIYFLISNSVYCSTMFEKPNRFYLFKHCLNFIIKACSSTDFIDRKIFNRLCLVRVNRLNFKSVIICNYEFIYNAFSGVLSLFIQDRLDKLKITLTYSNTLSFALSDLSKISCVNYLLSDFSLRAKKSNDSKEAK